MSEIFNPHDKFFKETFARPEVAREFLLHRLPVELLETLDLDTLQLQKDSFVDPTLQEHFTDLLYQVSFINQMTGYIYLLFEHKSYPDKWTAFQFLRYLVHIWEQWHREHPDEDLPLILPILIYQGRVKWPFADNFAALFSGPDSFRRYWPDFTFELTDLSEYDESQLKGELLLRVVLFTMRLIHNRKLVPQLPEMFALIMKMMPGQTAIEFLDMVLRYVAYASDNVTGEDLRGALRHALADKGEVVMSTLVREWLEEGMQKGLQKGRQEGRQEGTLYGQQLAILEILRTRFGGDEGELAAAIQQINDPEHLKTLLRRAVLVESLESFHLN